MGRETVDVRATFNLSGCEREADEALVEDFRAAVGALLALPRYAEASLLDEGCTAAYRAMDPDQRHRVLGDLITVVGLFPECRGE